MGMRLEVIRTKDGSPSLRLVELDECYHSRNGARSESLHVYIRNGFDAWLHEHPVADAIRIFEMGFGTGLNAFLTAEAAAGHSRLVVDYHAVELNPVPEGLWRQLEFSGSESRRLFDLLHSAPYDRQVEVTSRFFLTKYLLDVREYDPDHAFDLIYFDAFGPRAQPELWMAPVLQKIAGWLKPDGLLVTYCTKGIVKRGFRSGGFHVEAPPGPPGKREMLRVTRPSGVR